MPAAAKESVRILGIDPGLRHTGWGIIDCLGTRITHVAHGVITPNNQAEFSDRLLYLFNAVSDVVETYRPQEAAIEETFLSTNVASALKLGHARASAMVAPARAGVPVSEYAARLVKKAIVGTGGADKQQIGFMIQRLLPSALVTQEDAADALAVAITHAHFRGPKALARL